MGTLVLLTECRRRSLLLLHPPSRSRPLLHQRESTLSGSEDQSLLPSPPSSRWDLQAGVRRVRPSHCSPQVLLNCFIILCSRFIQEKFLFKSKKNQKCLQKKKKKKKKKKK